MLEKLHKKNIYRVKVCLPDVGEKALSGNAGTWRISHNHLDKGSAPSKPCEGAEPIGRKVVFYIPWGNSLREEGLRGGDYQAEFRA